MGIVTNRNNNNADNNSINVRYSAFLGGLYVSNQESEAKIAAAKVNAGGESEVKKGYAGNGADSASGKALRELRKNGVDLGIRVDGELTSVFTRENDGTDGRKYKYLVVGLRDGDDRFYLSTGFDGAATQALIRKLVNAEPGERVTLNMFATYDESKTQTGRFFSNHRASVKAGDAEIPGVDPKAELTPLLEDAKKKLEAAGIDDKETIGKRVQVVTNDWHASLVKEIEAKFAAHYEANGQSHEAEAQSFNANDVPAPEGGEQELPVVDAAAPEAAAPAADAPAAEEGTVRQAAASRPARRFRQNA